MNVDEIIVELTPLFRSEFDDQALVVKPEMTAADVENWDSITNIQLIVAIEKKYKIRFTSREIQDFKNVGEICESIIAKAAN
jgi:acyl carrier protein